MGFCVLGYFQSAFCGRHGEGYHAPPIPHGLSRPHHHCTAITPVYISRLSRHSLVLFLGYHTRAITLHHTRTSGYHTRHIRLRLRPATTAKASGAAAATAITTTTTAITNNNNNNSNSNNSNSNSNSNNNKNNRNNNSNSSNNNKNKNNKNNSKLLDYRAACIRGEALGGR